MKIEYDKEYNVIFKCISYMPDEFGTACDTVKCPSTLPENCYCTGGMIICNPFDFLIYRAIIKEFL